MVKILDIRSFVTKDENPNNKYGIFSDQWFGLIEVLGEDGHWYHEYSHNFFMSKKGTNESIARRVITEELENAKKVYDLE